VIVGVGTARTGESITHPNDQATYEQWEFWYDPRIEMLRKQVNIMGGSVSSTDASNFGQGINGQPNGASGSTGGTGGTGTQPVGTPPTGIGGFGSSGP
jgi:hypothetical protein